MGVMGAIIAVYTSVFLGALAGMDRGISNPQMQFNTAYGEQAGWKIGELVGLAIGIILAFIIVKSTFKNDGDKQD